MIGWMVYWVWWMTWRVAVTLACVFTIQHIIQEEQGIYIESRPFLIGALLLVLLIRIWSTAKEHK